ncbi:MAG: hypothetical protein HYX24_07100 [Candidatus Aenigmarchaeota archaeon]|nr:hypothetical protein [Candidatus Aenigmarchaeota archaeon]
MKRNNIVILVAALILLLAAVYLYIQNAKPEPYGCTRWCRDNGYASALSNSCQPIGSCVKGLLLPSESKSVCPETLEGCCCAQK